jgi:hypothetical protein
VGGKPDYIFCPDSRGFNTASKDARSCNEHSPNQSSASMPKKREKIRSTKLHREHLNQCKVLSQGGPMNKDWFPSEIWLERMIRRFLSIAYLEGSVSRKGGAGEGNDKGQLLRRRKGRNMSSRRGCSSLLVRKWSVKIKNSRLKF